MQSQPRLTPKSSDKFGDAFAAYATPSGSSSASIPFPGLKLNKSTHNVRQTLAQHGMQIDVERLQENYKPFEGMTRNILSGERGSGRCTVIARGTSARGFISTFWYVSCCY